MCDSNTDKKSAIYPAVYREIDSVTYEIEKRIFVVTPAYREDTDKTIYNSLLNLMIKDIEDY